MGSGHRMSEPVQNTVTAPAVKVITAWAAVGITSWADVASVLAALYTLILIIDWAWKKFGRPFAEDRGWVKRRRRRADDTWAG